MLVMDDVDAGYALEGLAKANDIKIKLCISIIIELMRRKRLSRAQTIKAIKGISKIREWEGGVLEVLIQKYLKEL